MKRQYLIWLAAALFCLAAGAWPSAAAADTNVTDWIKEDGPAESEAPAAEPAEVKETSFAALAGQLILYTALILILIYGLIRFLAARQKTMHTGSAIQLLGGAGLGSNKSVQLIKVGDEIFLLGVGNEITLLKEYSGSDDVASIGKMASQPQNKLPGALADFIRTKVGNRDGNTGTEKNSFNSMFEQSLAKQKAQQTEIEQQLKRVAKEERNR